MFRAYDAERERLVAVKLFKLDLPPERVHQLAAELEQLTTAELSHPAMAVPLAAGITGVTAYLAQDYVAAESLDLAVREYGPAPPADALRVAAQLAGALDFAAVVNITHGALHPRDVLLSADETRLTGIGIARALEKIGVSAPIRRPYTAPERVDGVTWDRKADIYSLAALMYELLWGRRISGPGPHAVEAITELAGGDVAALRAAFARALADDPRDRFDTALDFAEALKDAFPDVAIAPQPAPARARRPSAEPRRPELEAVEPRLPLDEPSPLSTPIEPVIVAPLQTDTPAAPFEPADIDLRAAEAARYDQVEASPAFVPVDVRPEPVDAPPLHPPLEAVPHEPAHASSSLVEQSRSAIWPLAAALLIGLGVGFAGGYGVGTRDRAAPSQAQATTPAAPAREATEVAVSDPKLPAPIPDVAKADAAPAPKQTPAPIAPQTRKSEPEAAETGRLLVRSTPAGARVTIDGRDAGVTPATVRNLGPGVHRVRVERDGYVSEDRRVTLTRSRLSESLTFELERQRAAAPTQRRTAAADRAAAADDDASGTSGRYAAELLVDSRPAGANVFLDGRLVGTTPLTLKTVRAGEHAIRLERDGYRRWSSSVRVVAAEQNRVTASLEK